MFDFLKRKGIAHEFGDENMGRIQAVIGWLNAEPGRKRIVGLGLLAVAQALHGLDAVFATLCAMGWLHGFICRIDPDSWVVYVSALNQFLQQYVVPSSDAAGLVLAAWGFGHAFVRAKDDGHANATAVIAAMTASVPPPMPPSIATVIVQEPKV